MALYQYDYLTKTGKKSSWIQAESLEDAKLCLVKTKKAVISVKLAKVEKITPLSGGNLTIFTQELSKLLTAGLPLFESLTSLEEKYQKESIKRLILDLKDQVKSGKLFSEALRLHPKSFDHFYISMVENGEKRGALQESLQDIYEVLSKQQKLKRQIISSLLYPAVLLSFCFLVLLVLLFYVVPSLAELFDERPSQGLTQLVLSLSDFSVRHKFGVFSFFFSLPFLGYFLAKSKNVKESFRKVILCLPLARTFFQKIALMKFCKALSSLLKGGVPLLQGIRLAKNMMNHPSLEKALQKVEAGILEGGGLSEELKKCPQIPKIMIRLLSLSEQGGNVAFMLDYLCQIYEEEVEKSLQRFTVLLQPILLIVLGAMVGTVLLSVLLPLTDISSFTSSF